MHTDRRPAGSGRGDGRHGRRTEPGHGREPAAPATPAPPTGADRPGASRDAYEDERDQAIDADPQLRKVGRARLRRRAGRPGQGDGSGAADG